MMDTPCIDSGRPRDRDGYAYATHEGRRVRAHRLAYVQHHGLTLDDIKGQNVCHACDHPWCENGAHLWLGSQRQNLQDMTDKGRRRTGPRVLGDEQVRFIRANKHMPDQVLSDVLGAAVVSIHRVRHGMYHKAVPRSGMASQRRMDGSAQPYIIGHHVVPHLVLAPELSRVADLLRGAIAESGGPVVWEVVRDAAGLGPEADALMRELVALDAFTCEEVPG